MKVWLLCKGNPTNHDCTPTLKLTVAEGRGLHISLRIHISKEQMSKRSFHLVLQSYQINISFSQSCRILEHVKVAFSFPSLSNGCYFSIKKRKPDQSYHFESRRCRTEREGENWGLFSIQRELLFPKDRLCFCGWRARRLWTQANRWHSRRLLSHKMTFLQNQRH